MKLEILNPDPSGTRGYQVYDPTNRRYLTNPDTRQQREFDEDALRQLLGEKKYNRLACGVNTFEVPCWHVFNVTRDFTYYKPDQEKKHV